MQGLERYIVLGRHGQIEPLREQIASRKVAITCTLPLIGGVLCDVPEVSAQDLIKLDNVVWIERDYRVYVVGNTVPILKNSLFESIPWGVRRVKAPSVWDTTRGNGVRVGVLDTGIDRSHPDLIPNLADGINILKPEAPPSDNNGHGTHVAGTIAAARNGRGVVGVAPKAVLVPIKAFDENGESRLSSVVQGIEWAVQNKIHVLNMSFGMEEASLSMRRAINAAFSAGVGMIAASGNKPEKQSVDYPARFHGVLGVGATTEKNDVADFSTGGVGLDLVAPGGDILSTWPDGKLERVSGTSMAAAHISGAAALILAIEPGLGPNDLFDRLLEAAELLPGVAASRQGAGLLNLARIFG